MTGERVRFALLGPVRAWVGDRDVDLGAPQQRAVLALLAAQAGRPVSVGELVDALWPQAAPSTAVNTVHRSIGLLRRALEPDLALRSPGRFIARGGGGYRLVVGEDDVDASRFRSLARAARSAGPTGTAAANGAKGTAGEIGTAGGDAVALYCQALSLWQAPVGTGLDEVVRAHPVFVALDREVLAVACAAADVATASGEVADLLPIVQRIAATALLDEPVQARLVLLLAANGRTAEALAVFDRARRELATELGLDPGPDLRRAQAHVLRQTSPEVPPAVQYTPRQLPADLATFSGRARELAWALSTTEARGTVVISAIGGMAGIGKSTLAVHWGHRVAKSYPDGQLYVNLHGFDETEPAVDPSDALHGFLAALGVDRQAIPATLDQQAALYRSRTADRRMLVLLDNARDEAQVRPLLPGGPGCLVIVTSRRPLSGLVAVDGAHPLRLDLLAAAEARALLAARVGADRLAAEPVAVDDIVAFCGGLPLALAVVAARALTRTPFSLAATAADLRLDALSQDDPVSSLRAVFAASYRTLTPAAGRLFRLLSLCPADGVTPTVLASLADVRPLGELVRAELAVEMTPGRYGQHDLIRAYAAELYDTTEREHGSRCLYDHYLATLVNAEAEISPSLYRPDLPGPADGVRPERFASQAGAVDWLQAEESALIGLVERAGPPELDRHIVLLTVAMRAHLDRSVPPTTVLTVLRHGRDAAVRVGDVRHHGRINRSVATAYIKIAQFDDAIAALDEARDLAARDGDEKDQAQIMYVAARILDLQNRRPEALGLIYEANSISERLGEQRSLARGLSAAGWLHAQDGDYEQAITVCERAIVIYRDIDEVSGEAATWDSIGFARRHLGQYSQAIQAYEQSLELCRQVGDRDMEATVLDGLGDTHRAGGNPAAAQPAWQQSLRIFDDLGRPTAAAVRAKLAADDPASRSAH